MTHEISHTLHEIGENDGNKDWRQNIPERERHAKGRN